MVDSFRCSGEEKIWLPVGQCQLTFDPFNKGEMKRIITLECLMQREGPNFLFRIFILNIYQNIFSICNEVYK